MTDSAARLPQPHRTFIVAVMLAGAFVAILNETLLNVALPPIMHDFHITANSAQWLTTAYLLTGGILIPVTALLVQRIATRTLFLLGMGAFALGTLLAGLAPTFAVLLMARVVQASGAAIILPLLMNVVLTVYAVEERGAAMGFIGLVITFAPAIGPTLSGWLVSHHSWHLLFFIVLPIALADMAVAARGLRNILPLSRPRIDGWSLLMSSVGFGGLLYGFSVAGSGGWHHDVVWGSLGIAILSLAGFIRRQLGLTVPMLEFRVFRFGMFSLSTGITILVFMSMFSAMLLLPLYLQNVRGLTPLASGLLVMPGAVVMGIMSPIAGRIFDRIGGRWLGVVGSALLVSTLLRFSHLAGSTSYATLLVAFIGMMLGMSLIMMPVMTAGLNQLPPHLYPHGTAMSNTLQQVGGAIGTALLVTVMSMGTRAALAQDAALGGNTPGMIQQATIHGMDEAFLVGAGFAMLSFLLCFFLQGPSLSQAAVPANETRPG